jgi:hypothetical protein
MAVAPKIFNGDTIVHNDLSLEGFKTERATGSKSGNTSIITITLSSQLYLAEWGGLKFFYSEAMTYADAIMATNTAVLRSFECKHFHGSEKARDAGYSENARLVITIVYLSSFWET